MGDPPGLVESVPMTAPRFMEAPKAPDFSAVVGAIGGRWPKIQPHLEGFVVKKGDPANNVGGGHLEFYPPWESHNPHPGKSTIEIFDDKLQGKELEDMIAGDMLHLLGSKNPETDKPVDPEFYEMKQRLLSTLTPQQLAIDKREYEHAMREMPNDQRTFAEWMETSRGDAYIRGYITPDSRDEWRQQGVYTPKQTAILEEMRGYLEAK